jgi:lysophospholipase L1-like esterase
MNQPNGEIPETASPRRRHVGRRAVLWMLLGIVSILAALAYREFWLARPIGSGPAGPTVPREPFASVWTERPVLLLGVGDSITAGLGAASPERSYFERLVQNPPHEFADMQEISLSQVLPNLQKHNMALSGSTSLYHLNSLEERLEPQPVETLGLVVMTTGGNDLIHNYGRTAPREGAMYGATVGQAEPWITNFAVRLDKMLDVIDQRFPGGCHIFLADIYDPTDGCEEIGCSRLAPRDEAQQR